MIRIKYTPVFSLLKITLPSRSIENLFPLPDQNILPDMSVITHDSREILSIDFIDSVVDELEGLG